MRSFLAIVILNFMIVTASTQESSMWLGGTLGLSGQDNGQTQSTLTLMPEFGYNTGGAWAIGVRAGLVTEKTVVEGNTQRNNTTTIKPFAQYTFGDVAGFKVFGQGELPLQFYGGKHFDGSSMEGSNSIGFRVRPGISYYFNKSWGFKMLMPPVLDFVNSGDGSSSYNFGINDGYTIQRYLLSTSIGFIYKF